MLECVVNVSEGTRTDLVQAVAASAGEALIDLHSDPWHNRSVLTLAGPEVVEAARAVASSAVELLHLSEHSGAHPRLGVVDVVPFAPILDAPAAAGAVELSEATRERDRFARWAARALCLPCFLYGPERSLPELRKGAFRTIAPDTGPRRPHPSAGAACVGARGPLVAYNLWLEGGDSRLAKAIARSIRRPGLRALGLDLGGRAQVSCNVVDPALVGIGAVYDEVRRRAAVERPELVGLLPSWVLEAEPRRRWAELGLSEDRTIEARLQGGAAASRRQASAGRELRRGEGADGQGR